MTTFDDGILTIYSVGNAARAGEKPRSVLRLKSQHYFSFMTVGAIRYYEAKQAMNDISDMVRIWEDRDITTLDICVLEDGNQYKCAQVQHVVEDGLRQTQISLERLNEEYEILDED